MWAPHSYFTIYSESWQCNLWWISHRRSQNHSEWWQFSYVLRTSVSHDSAVMVALTQMYRVVTMQLWCFTRMFLQSHWIVTMQLWQVSHRFSWNHIVSSDNAVGSLTDVIGTTASPNKHATRSHWAQYSVSSRDCSLVLVGDSLTDVLWIPVSCDMNNG